MSNGDLGPDPRRAAPEALKTGADAGEARTGAQVGPVDKRSRVSVPETAALFVVLVVLFVFFALASPFFFSDRNIIVILQQSALIGMIACPATLLLISAQFDLSVGSIAGFTGMLLAVLAAPPSDRTPFAMGLDLEVAIVIAFGGALLVGIINGISVTVFRINALITTLGTLAIFRGLTRVLGGGQTIRVNDFGTLGLERVFGIPIAVWIFIGVVIAFWLLLRYSTYGRSMYAIGSSPTAARLAGIRTSRAIFVGFLLSAALAGLAGVILLSSVGAAANNAGETLMLAVITAVVLGGASLAGGRGSIVGTVLAVLIVSVLRNGLVQIGVQSFWIEVATGVLLLVAVGADQLRIRLTQAES